MAKIRTKSGCANGKKEEEPCGSTVKKEEKRGFVLRVGFEATYQIGRQIYPAPVLRTMRDRQSLCWEEDLNLCSPNGRQIYSLFRY